MENVKIFIAAVPDNWMSADEMRDYASECRTDEANLLISNLMEMMMEKAEKGKMGSTSFTVRGGRSAGVYIQAQEMLRALGYKVEGDYDESPCNRDWTIAW